MARPYLTLSNGSTIALDKAICLDSREADMVFLLDLKALKIFTTAKSAHQAFNAMETAAEAGVPVVGNRQFYTATLTLNGKPSTVYVLETERCVGHFFKLSDPGGVKRFLNTVEDAADCQGVGIWKTVSRGFKAAHDVRVTDPQGIFDPARSMPLRFFDVHTSNHPAPQIADVINACDAAINEI